MRIDLSHPFTNLVTAFNDRIVEDTTNFGGREIGKGKRISSKNI